MANITEVVVVNGAAGTGRKDLKVTVVDEFGVPINITSSTVRLQGESLDLPAVPLDVAGTLLDPSNGVARWASIGTALTIANLGALEDATYVFRVKLTDAAAKVDFGPEFSLKFIRTPLV